MLLLLHNTLEMHSAAFATPYAILCAKFCFLHLQSRDCCNSDQANLQNNSPQTDVFERFATELDPLKGAVQFQQLKMQ